MIRYFQRLFLLILMISLNNSSIQAMLRKTTTYTVNPRTFVLFGSQYRAFPWQTRYQWYMPAQEYSNPSESNFNQYVEEPFVYQVEKPMYSVYKEYPKEYKTTSNFQDSSKFLYKKEFQQEHKSDKKYSEKENSSYFFYGIDLRKFLKRVGIAGIISSMGIYVANNPQLFTKPIKEMLETEAEIEGTDLYTIKKLIDSNDWKGLEAYLNDVVMQLDIKVQEKLNIEQQLSLLDPNLTFLKFISFLKIKTDLIEFLKIIIGIMHCGRNTTTRYADDYVTYILDKVVVSKSSEKIENLNIKLKNSVILSNLDMFNFYIKYAFNESNQNKKDIAENCIMILIHRYNSYSKTDNKSYEYMMNVLINLDKKTDDRVLQEIIRIKIPDIQNVWLQEKLKKYAGLE